MGVDLEPSVNALFPLQKIQLRLIDHFNVNKTRMLIILAKQQTGTL